MTIPSLEATADKLFELLEAAEEHREVITHYVPEIIGNAINIPVDRTLHHVKYTIIDMIDEIIA